MELNPINIENIEMKDELTKPLFITDIEDVVINDVTVLKKPLDKTRYSTVTYTLQ